MGELIRENGDISINTNILIKKEDGIFIAHSLEMDIVATGCTADQAQRECISLICAQIEYAFTHDNLDNLLHSAPPNVWSDFFACKEQREMRYRIEKRLEEANQKSFLPTWLTAKTCNMATACHA